MLLQIFLADSGGLLVQCTSGLHCRGAQSLLTAQQLGQLGLTGATVAAGARRLADGSDGVKSTSAYGRDQGLLVHPETAADTPSARAARCARLQGEEAFALLTIEALTEQG